MVDLKTLFFLNLCFQHICVGTQDVLGIKLPKECKNKIPTTSGTEIDCSNRKMSYVPQDMPPNVTHLNLRNTQLSSLHRAFVNYPNLIYLDISDNDLSVIHNETFHNLSKLEVLEMAYSKINDLDLEAFQYLVSLKSLNLACNGIGLGNVVNVLANAPFQIQYLMLDRTHQNDKPLVIDHDTLQGIDFTKLQGLSLQNEDVAYLDITALDVLRGVKYLVMGFNYITALKPRTSNKAYEIAFTTLKDIISIDFSHFYNPIGRMFENKYCSRIRLNDQFRYPMPDIVHEVPFVDTSSYNVSGMIKNDYSVWSNLPPNLRYVTVTDWPNTFYDNLTLHMGVSNIQYLNISKINIRGIWPVESEFNFLEILDMSKCGLEYMKPDISHICPNLRYLYLQGNKLGLGKNRLKKTFHNLKKLVHLDLSDNGLRKIDKGAFDGLHNLKFLNLARNLFKFLDLDMKTLSSLMALDLSSNQLSLIEPAMSRTLEILNQTIKICLSQNIFICDCTDTTGFVQWIYKHRMERKGSSTHLKFDNVRSYSCSKGNESVLQFLKTKMDSAAGMCEQHKPTGMITNNIYIHMLLIYTVIPSVLVGIPLIVGLLSYCCRWKIRWWYYSCKLRLFYKPNDRETPENPWINHAFVAHSFHSDVALSWTINTLIPKVEGEWGFRLFVWERDSEAGCPIADNIVKAIRNSGMTIIIVEPALCSDEWTDFIFHMALIKSRYLLIRIEDVELSQVNHVLHQMMRKGCLEWPFPGVTSSENGHTHQNTSDIDVRYGNPDDHNTPVWAEESESRFSSLTECLGFRDVYFPSTDISHHRTKQEKYFWKCLKKTLTQTEVMSNEHFHMTSRDNLLVSVSE